MEIVKTINGEETIPYKEIERMRHENNPRRIIAQRGCAASSRNAVARRNSLRPTQTLPSSEEIEDLVRPSPF